MGKSGTLTVRVVGDTKPLEGSLGKLGGMAGKAFAAVGVAAAATAVKAVADFAGFEKQMNEVFTLLPGISEKAMGQMTGQVKDFAKQFGVLPTETVPALYQALSAGVPKDNVFEFLEVAQKAAKGGVTELETAVDGISGVVNAYGSDIISATEASDLMFTAVRLGKTTFEEMSASLGDVTPIAGALGVSFEEVTAALAASTSITGNTAKSVTGLKSLMAELGKEGQVAARHFEEAAGTSFPKFIEGGGTLAEALDIMKQSADESGGSIMDMFGGIEAGQAALQLTGSDTFVQNLQEMQGAAGATDAAFVTMDQGIGVVWEKLRAGLAVALLDIGNALAPFVEKLGELALTVLPMVSAGISVVTGFFAGLAATFQPLIQQVANVRDTFAGVFGGGGDVEGHLTAFSATMATVWANVQGIVAGATTAIKVIIDTFVKVATDLWNRFGKHLISFFQTTWKNVQQVLEGATRVIKGVLDVFVGIFTGDWSKFWGGIQQIVSGVWSVIHGILRQAVNAISTIIGAGMALVSAAWSLAWNAVKTALSAAWDGIKSVVSTAIGAVVTYFTELPGRILGALGNLGGLLVNAGREILDGLWRGLKQKWEDVSSWVGGLGAKIKNLKGPIHVDRKLLTNEGQAIMGGFLGGLTDGWRDVQQFLSGATAEIPALATAGVPVGGRGAVRGGVASQTAGGYSHATIYLQLDGRTIAELIGEPLVDEIRLRAGVR